MLIQRNHSSFTPASKGNLSSSVLLRPAPRSPINTHPDPNFKNPGMEERKRRNPTLKIPTAKVLSQRSDQSEERNWSRCIEILLSNVRTFMTHHCSTAESTPKRNFKPITGWYCARSRVCRSGWFDRTRDQTCGYPSLQTSPENVGQNPT